MIIILTVGLSQRLLCSGLSNSSSLIERTLDDQCLVSSNDTTSVAKHSVLKSHMD